MINTGSEACRRRVIVVGHSSLDHVFRISTFPARPTKVRALEHIEEGGGGAANAAAAIAMLGGRAELWSRIGDDEAGRNITASLKISGVDTSNIHLSEHIRTPTAAVIVDESGERLVVSEDDGDLPMNSDWLPLHHIEVAGAMLSDLSWLEGTLSAFGEAREIGVPTILDIDLAGGALLPQVLHVTDYAIFSAAGFERFVPGVDYPERLAWLIAAGVRHAGVTCGANGYRWMNRDGRQGSQCAFPVQVIDTTGAGDAFHGAFALALSQALCDEECARLASAVAALKCRQLGARAGLPTISEVDAFLLEQTGRGLSTEVLSQAGQPYPRPLS